MITPESVLADLDAIDASTYSPWVALVEDRDFQSGASFIMAGNDLERGDDIYVSKDGIGADADLLDLIAEMRTLLPVLLAAVRQLRENSSSPSQSDVERFEKLFELSHSCEAPPWRVELSDGDSGGRDRISAGGDNFVRAHIEVITDSGPADASLLTAITVLRNEIDSLLMEVLPVQGERRAEISIG